jgi:glucokinase
MADRPVILGLDFGGTKFAIAVAEPAGARLATREIDSAAGSGARTGFDRCVRAARELLAEAAPGRPLAAVGASTFGIPFDDRVELAPAIPGWEELALGRELRGAFPEARVTVTTDVKAAAAAEARWGVLAGCDPAVYLNLGTGLAVAVVSGGRVLSGAHGASGEIGYNLRAVADVGVALEERTMLEDVVSGRALGSAQEVFAAAGHDPAAAALVEAFTGELAFHLVNLAILVDPQRIAVGGGMTRSFALLRPVLERALHAGAPYPPELVLARFPHDAPLRGALALAAEPLDHQAHRGPAKVQPLP